MSLADEFEEEWDFRVPPTSSNRLLRDRILAALRDAEIAESRTVTDAQRERIYKRLELQMHRVTATQLGNDILAILEEQPAAESLEGNL